MTSNGFPRPKKFKKKVGVEKSNVGYRLKRVLSIFNLGNVFLRVNGCSKFDVRYALVKCSDYGETNAVS